MRIPGLGKLGVLPKMDFGLELLYGANEGVKQPDPVEQPSDDLTIRGTMKQTSSLLLTDVLSLLTEERFGAPFAFLRR